MEAVRLEKIHKSYSRGKVSLSVLKGVSLTVMRGEMVALMGVSGSGKTTLVNILGSLDRPTLGRYWLDGEEISQLSVSQRALLRNETVGFVFQNFNLLPRLTALENVMMPLAYARRSLPDRLCRTRAEALLGRMGLGDRLNHEQSRLSGGEQQRVAIARALVNRCSLLIADEPTGNLDSKTGEEILQLFRQINAVDGLTIVLVTHDPMIARHAGRIVWMRDGVITDGEGAPAGTARHVVGVDGSSDKPSLRRTSGLDPDRGAPATPRTASGRGLPDARRYHHRDYARAIVMALRSLRRNVLRSALTTIGIIIGIGSLITIADVGRGSETAIKKVLSGQGANNLLIQAGAASSNGISLGSGTIKTLTPADAEAIVNECSAVDSLAPIISAHRQVVFSKRNWVPISLQGTTPGLLRVRNWEELAEGEPFTDEDVRDVALVCLIGKTLVHELFEDNSPLGKEVNVNGVPLKVIGVLGRKGTNILGFDQDDILLAPWTTIKYRVSAASSPQEVRTPEDANGLASAVNLLSRYPRSTAKLYPDRSAVQLADSPKLERFSNVDFMLVRAGSIEEVPVAMAQITELLRERHRIGPDQEDDFHVRDFTEIIMAAQRVVGLVSGLLVCVTLISLLVGGVGVMNIMLVSVTERYREIGIRMAVGASPGDILRQFLVESVVLCMLGGVLGILAGRVGSSLIRWLAHWPTESSLIALIGSVSVSATIGIVFGYYPAWKASCLDPIEALRCE